MNHLKSSITALTFGLVGLFSMAAQAGTSVQWTDPANNSSYAAGTTVNIQGQAGADGQIGGGLDLVLVLDSSGSMGTTSCEGGVCKTRQQWQRDAAIALINNLSTATTSVGIVEFDSSTNTVRTLLDLSSNSADLIAAINSVNAGGGTNIGLGINEATTVLTGADHTVGRPQHMVVFSDGFSSGNPSTNATNAVAAGIEAVHSVALPGANLATMSGIAANGNGTFIDATNNLQGLIDIFSGTTGSLVNLDYVDVELADGTVLHDVATDAFGNFDLDVLVALGANDFIATAYGTDGTSATETLTLHGTATDVPAPGSLALLGLGLAGLGAMRRKA